MPANEVLTIVADELSTTDGALRLPHSTTKSVVTKVLEILKVTPQVL